MIEEPWDSGLQNDRTRLAWQRTVLSGMACSLVVARLLASISLAVAIGLAVAAMISSAVLGRLSSRRYWAAHVALHSDHPIGDGRAHALLVALVALTALATLAYAVLR